MRMASRFDVATGRHALARLRVAGRSAHGKGTALLPLLPPTNAKRHQRRRAFRHLVAATSVPELLEAIEKSPVDSASVLGVAAELRSPADEALPQLEGDWVVLWSDLGKPKTPQVKSPARKFVPNLKMLSFGALPPVEIAITGSYNRVQSNLYELLQVFQLPDSNITAAMVLGAPCAPDPEQSNRLTVQFDSVRVVLPLEAGEGCIQALEEAGLGDAIKGAIPIDAPSTYIDIEYIDSTLRVHTGQTGTTYVLKRLHSPDKIPFSLD